MDTVQSMVWGPWGQNRAAAEIGWWEAVRRELLLDAASFRPAVRRGVYPLVLGLTVGPEPQWS